MRVMVLVKANADSEAGVMPDEELLTAMTRYNEELVKAGVMLAGEGLHPSSKGVRVRFEGDKRTVIDGPVRRDEGADRRLLALAGEVARRGDRMAQARAVRRWDGDRAASGLRDRGLRRGAHARAEGGERAPEGAGRSEAVVSGDLVRAATDDPGAVKESDTHRAIDAVWRIESARLIAGLARIVRDVGLAEELAQDALVAALEQWPESGVPDNPGAWLMATAKHRAIDLLRRRERLERKHQELGRELELEQERAEPDLDADLDDDIGDDLLSLVFTACHPVLSTDARVALTLRLVGGLTTEEIARAFLVPEADHCPADRARQANAHGGTRPDRGPSRARARRAGSSRCSRSSTSSSTRATRRPPARTGYGPRSARTRSGSAASSPSSRPTSRRSTASSR